MGIDLCLGSEADKEIGKRLQMFAPFYMKRYASDAYIVDKTGVRRPLVGWLQWRYRRIWWGWDVLLYASQGLAGCIIAFLFFFSVHPTVGSNWLLILFNPIPLFYLPVMIYKDVKHKKDAYHVVNLVYLTLFIVILPFCGQEFNLTVLPLALGLLVNSASHILVWNKK